MQKLMKNQDISRNSGVIHMLTYKIYRHIYTNIRDINASILHISDQDWDTYAFTCPIFEMHPSVEIADPSLHSAFSLNPPSYEIMAP